MNEKAILNKFILENSNASRVVLDEAIQTQAAGKILDKLFEMTIGKYNKIDFTEIEKSKGDITRVKFYKNLKECVDTLKEIDSVTHELGDIYIVDNAINNLIQLKKLFEDSFRIKNNCGIMIYNCIVHAIMESTSYIIAAAIDFVEEDGEVKVVSNMKNCDRTLISSLDKFNKCASDGTIYKFIKESEKSVLNEGVADTLLTFLATGYNGTLKNIASKAIPAILISLAAIAIIAFLKNMVYIFYKSKHTISESAKMQAELLELNIEKLRQKDGNEKIIAKQQKWVNRFKKIATAFAIESDRGYRDANIEMKQDKVDVSSVVI